MFHRKSVQWRREKQEDGGTSWILNTAEGQTVTVSIAVHQRGGLSKNPKKSGSPEPTGPTGDRLGKKFSSFLIG